MNARTLIFPNQLFEANDAVKPDPLIVLEDPMFFGDFECPVAFHKQKIVLHRASMKAFEARMKKKRGRVQYVSYDKLRDKKTYEAFFAKLASDGVETIRHYWTGDTRLEQRLEKLCKRHHLKRIVADSPAFMKLQAELDDYFDSVKKYHQTPFYIEQRKQRGILLDRSGAPSGGKWTYDVENRERVPNNLKLPTIVSFGSNGFVREAKTYVDKNFSKNPGTTQNFRYPVTTDEAKKLLADFLKHRLEYFGRYQDGMRAGEPFLFHSLLSSSINTGLLTPDDVVSATLAYAKTHKIPLASLEGFIRQIMGWREFVRAIYVHEGDNQRTINFWKHKRAIPNSFYDATTGIEPIDDCIRKVLAHSYNHHIERLMLLGNFMLLCEFHPDEVYRWFMEMYIDAYDWVMVPNVYGMSQFADGGLMVSKPYISSSNYVRKMSDYRPGPWCDIWDGLYWRFIEKHRAFFLRNPRLSMMARVLDRMDPKKMARHRKNATSFLRGLK